MSTQRVKGPTDPDHHAAWVACREPWVCFDNSTVDLRPILEDLLKSGWSIGALKAYAHHFRFTGHSHLTPYAWRWAVRFAGEGGAMVGDFLARYKQRHAPAADGT